MTTSSQSRASKVTQMQMAFYKLHSDRAREKKRAYIAKVEPKYRFIPTWEFVGEMHIKEIDTWVLMSYKCPTRLTDIYQHNPNLLERQLVTGKSGSKYFAYRIAPQSTLDLVVDPNLKDFYGRLAKQ